MSTHAVTTAVAAITPRGSLVRRRWPAALLSAAALLLASAGSAAAAANPITVNTANWTGSAGFASAAPGWYKDSFGLVHLEGAAKQTSASGGLSAITLGTLPKAARPARDLYFMAHTFDGTYAVIQIDTDGTILVDRPAAPVGVHATEQQGATVTAMLSRPRALALLVSAERGGRLVNVGVVHLGSHKAGLSYIHWNLVVNQRVLPAGRYEVSLHALNGALLSVPASPGALTLVVQANGDIHTQ
ncbi:MAG: hypothetical protein ACLP01_13920 [Solirubrobacteraceae bacterium]